VQEGEWRRGEFLKENLWSFEGQGQWILEASDREATPFLLLWSDSEVSLVETQVDILGEQPPCTCWLNVYVGSTFSAEASLNHAGMSRC
jgi:hypothetical protein